MVENLFLRKLLRCKGIGFSSESILFTYDERKESNLRCLPSASKIKRRNTLLFVFKPSAYFLQKLQKLNLFIFFSMNSFGFVLNNYLFSNVTDEDV